MAKHSIRIIVDDGTNSQPETSPQVIKGNQAKPNASVAQPKMPTAMVYMGAKSLAKKAFSYQISNVGFYTGNMEKQNEINNTLEIVNGISSVAMGALGGAAFGPVGMVAGAGLAFATELINKGQQQQKYDYQIKQDNLQAQYMRSFLNGANSNNRGKK